jgi:methylated-DNA-protein-cysteine methyltransferase-like protein
MTPFRKRVLDIVARIPRGKVTSYGDVAAMAGQPRAARGVGWILNNLPPDTDLPWWRVVNRIGGLSTYKLPVADAGHLQRARLEAESVPFDKAGADGKVAGDEWWWRPEPEELPEA